MGNRAQSTICLGLLILIAGCDGATHREGRVVDSNDKPIDGVTVRLFAPEASRDVSRTTDTSGNYSVGFTHAPSSIPLVVTATKEGYKTYRKEFKSGESKNLSTTIVLEVEPLISTEAK